MVSSTSVISAGMHCKICGKLGFVSWNYAKAVCFETTLKVFNFLHAHN